MVRARFLDRSKLNPQRQTTAEAHTLADRLGIAVRHARQLASSVSHGIHGRRRSGTGEDFWQFRPLATGESSSRVDWRRSARERRLYVREREWQAARTVWLWVDQSSSMEYISELADCAKIERALILALALADILVKSGERVGIPTLAAPQASRNIIEKLALALSRATEETGSLLSGSITPPGPRDSIVLFSDFLSPINELHQTISRLSERGARGLLVMVLDPVEELFPFSGQSILYEEETGLSLRIGDASSWRDEYLNQLTSFRNALQQIARDHGWLLVPHHTDRPASEVMLKLLTLLGDDSHDHSWRAG